MSFTKTTFAFAAVTCASLAYSSCPKASCSRAPTSPKKGVHLVIKPKVERQLALRSLKTPIEISYKDFVKLPSYGLRNYFGKAAFLTPEGRRVRPQHTILVHEAGSDKVTQFHFSNFRNFVLLSDLLGKRCKMANIKTCSNRIVLSGLQTDQLRVRIPKGHLELVVIKDGERAPENTLVQLRGFAAEEGKGPEFNLAIVDATPAVPQA